LAVAVATAAVLALLVVTPLAFVAFKRWSFQLCRAARIGRPPVR
jgi:hypothetical protein